jgi:hypothetical protein
MEKFRRFVDGRAFSALRISTRAAMNVEVWRKPIAFAEPCFPGACRRQLFDNRNNFLGHLRCNESFADACWNVVNLCAADIS